MFNDKINDIYRIYLQVEENNSIKNGAAQTPLILAETLKENIPEIKDYVRLKPLSTNMGNYIISFGDNKYEEAKILYAEQSFFSIFSFNLIKGDKNNLLNNPNTIVLTKSNAEKYFGREDPINKVLSIQNRNGNFICKVTGVIDDVPKDSHLNFGFLISLNTFLREYNVEKNARDWGYVTFHTYILTNSNISPTILQQKISEVVKKHDTFSNTSVNSKFQYILQALSEIHLHTPDYVKWDMAIKTNITNLKYLFFISLIIFFISIFNFSNLFLTKSLTNIRNNAVYQLYGNKLRIILFTYTEIFFLYLLSFFFSFLIVILSFPYINSYLLLNIELDILPNFKLIVGIIILLLFCMLLSGLIPSIFALSIKNSDIQKGSINLNIYKKINIFRKFSIIILLIGAIISITGTKVFNSQLNYMKNKDLGMDINNILIIKEPTLKRDTILTAKIATFISELKNYSFVENITSSYDIPGKKVSLADIFKLDNRDKSYPTSTTYVGYDFFNTYRIKLLAGETFLRGIRTNYRSVLINQSALNYFEFKYAEDAINHKLFLNNTSYNIIGVVNDFNYESPVQKIAPVVYTFSDLRTNFISIKLKSFNSNEIKEIKNKWDLFFKSSPINYFLLSGYYNLQYSDVRIFNSLFIILSVILLILSVISIFAIFYFEIIRQLKNIAIHKVLGGNFKSLVFPFNKLLLLLILVSCLIGCPIIYYLLNNWLFQFPYHIELSIFDFVFAPIIISIVSIFTLSYHLFYASRINPSKILQNE